jgi:hypothetical protein
MQLREDGFETETTPRDFPSGDLSVPVEDPHAPPEAGVNSICPFLPGERAIPPAELDAKATFGRFHLDPVPPPVVSDAARAGGINDFAPAAPTSADWKLRAANDDSVVEDTQPCVDGHETPKLGTRDKSSEGFPLASV